MHPSRLPDIEPAVSVTTTGPICIDLEDPGLSTATKRVVEEEVLKMLNESYERTRAMLRKYAKEHHMVTRPCLCLGLSVPVRFCLRVRPAAHTRSLRPALPQVANALLEHETLTGDELRALVGQDSKEKHTPAIEQRKVVAGHPEKRQPAPPQGAVAVARQAQP